MTTGKTVALMAACLACCLPLLLGVAGVTTGAAAAVGYWVGRHQVLIIAAIGLTYPALVAARHLRTRTPTVERIPAPTRNPAE